MVSAVVSDQAGRLTLVTKGAFETVLARCSHVSEEARVALQSAFDAGNRVVTVARRTVSTTRNPTPEDERDLQLLGFLVFPRPAETRCSPSLKRLAELGIAVKVVTGDNPALALKVCHELGLADASCPTGTQIDALDDAGLAAAIAVTTVFARVSPEAKPRIVRIQRRTGGGVAFLGDGVNDALTLHAADVGISVDSGTDVAKDAADVILLEKDLGVLADGVAEGRRISANTIKYVLMGTSSTFGNMFSSAAASLFLSFLRFFLRRSC
jgi:Mg2+-importing ATPase